MSCPPTAAQHVALHPSPPPFPLCPHSTASSTGRFASSEPTPRENPSENPSPLIARRDILPSDATPIPAWDRGQAIFVRWLAQSTPHLDGARSGEGGRQGCCQPRGRTMSIDSLSIHVGPPSGICFAPGLLDGATRAPSRKMHRAW